jgi:two-component sensor histidine kinase
MLPLFLSSISAALQFAAAVAALRLIPSSGRRLSWTLIAGALVLMGVRRLIPIIRYFSDGAYHIDLGAELVGLCISVLMLAGVWSIRSIFEEKAKAEAALTAALQEKDALLKETHHRVKNNMATAMSLLRLQRGAAAGDELRQGLIEAEDRLRAMASLYDRVYREDSYRALSLKDYLGGLAADIVASFPNGDRVRLELKLAELELPVKDLYHIGIMMTELVTNAMKYAFQGRGGTLLIGAEKRGDRVLFTLRDDGPGLPEGARDSGGFGLELLYGLAEQLGAVLTLRNDGGLAAELDYPLPT